MSKLLEPLTHLDEATRAWIYRVSLAAIALLVGYGIITEGEAANWALLAGAILGMADGLLATANTSTDDEG